MRLIKRISALLLAVSFFLPLAQCSQKLGSNSPPDIISAIKTDESSGWFLALNLLLFFWPLAIQLWQMIKGVRLPSRRALWAEVGLSALSLAGISWIVLSWVLSFGASIRYGTYVAYGSAFTYGAASFLEAIRARRRSGRGLSREVISTLSDR